MGGLTAPTVTAAISDRLAAGVAAKTGSSAFLEGKTGVQPVREDSASHLSADETTGWKPVGPDRRDGQYRSLKHEEKSIQPNHR